MNSKWISHGTNNDQADVGLILFTYAGGSPSIFAPWKRMIDSSVNMYPVLYPGREKRMKEPVPSELSQLIEGFVEENIEIFSKKFVFFGHCTGNIVAYETMKYLKKKYNKAPELMIVSGSNSPRRSVYGDILYDENGNFVPDEILADRMVKNGIVTADFKEDKNFISYYMPIYRDDLKIMGKTSEESPSVFDCDVRVMYGDEDDYIDEDGLKDWGNYTRGKVYYDVFPGSHFYITSCKEAVTAKINEYIKNIGSKGEKNG